MSCLLGWSCCKAPDFLFSQLYTNPNTFFSPNEHLLADSGYTASHTVIPAFKRVRGQTLTPQKQAFNTHLSQLRVEVEHCIGMIKNRWQSLKNLCVKLKDNQTAQCLVIWIRVCVILHNIMLEQGDTFDLSNLNESQTRTQDADISELDSETFGENTAYRDYLFQLFLETHRL